MRLQQVLRKAYLKNIAEYQSASFFSVMTNRKCTTRLRIKDRNSELVDLNRNPFLTKSFLIF